MYLNVTHMELEDIQQLIHTNNNYLRMYVEGDMVYSEEAFDFIKGLLKKSIHFLIDYTISCLSSINLFHHRISPIRNFKDKYKTASFVALLSDNPRYFQIPVYKPRGMQTSYSEAIKYIGSCLKEMDMVNLAKVFTGNATNMKNLIEGNKIIDIDELQLIIKPTLSKVVGFKKLSKQHDEMFGGSVQGEDVTTLFKDEFGSTKALKECIDGCLDLTTRFKWLFLPSMASNQVFSVSDELKKQEATYRGILKYIDENDIVAKNKKSISLIADYLEFSAATYSLFGNLINSLYAIEQNLVNVLISIDRIYKSA